MPNHVSDFILGYLKTRIRVKKYLVDNQTLYYVSFEDGRGSFVIGMSTDMHENKTWKSIPCGRDTEAQEIGEFITKKAE